MGKCMCDNVCVGVWGGGGCGCEHISVYTYIISSSVDWHYAVM